MSTAKKVKGKYGLFRSAQDGRTFRVNRHGRRLAEHAGTLNLPLPTNRQMELEFSPGTGDIKLNGMEVCVYRVSDVDADGERGYQREYEDNRARQYASIFNWALFGRPILNMREDGKIWVISGQHRIPAAGYAGHTSIPVAVYEGLTRAQEAYIFNQESTQRKGLTALQKFGSGVIAGYPDYVDIVNIVHEFGADIAIQAAPRTSHETYKGVVPVTALLDIYDHGGRQLFRETLSVVKEGFGTLESKKGIDGALYYAVALMLGIYNKGSKYGEVKRSKLVNKLQEITPESLKREATKFGRLEKVNRFLALVELYNKRTYAANRIEQTEPDWRKCGPKFCTSPECNVAGKKPKAVFKRGLCRQHYDQIMGW